MNTQQSENITVEIEQHQSIWKKRIVFFLFCLFIIGLVTISIIVNPEMLVQRIGVKNGYSIAFVISLFAGISAPTSATAYSFIATLIRGGLEPLLLGILTGFAFSVGDMLWFTLGSKGRNLITGNIDDKIKRVSAYIMEKNIERYIPIIGYIYITFSPFPNDWLLLFLAAIQFSPKKAYILIILGDISFMLFFSFLISHGITMFF